MDDNSTELIIRSGDGEVDIALVENKGLVEYHNEKLDKGFNVGDLFLGRVKRIVPGLNAAFVDVGYEKVDEPPIFPKKTNEYIVAQFDIDGDGVDELVLGIIDYEEILRDVQLTIYKYHPPLFTEDLNRSQNWQHLGTLTAYGIVGEVKIELKSRAVCIPRNHRGFYYKWTLADNKFIDIGDY